MTAPSKDEVEALIRRGRELLEASKNSRIFNLRAYLSNATPSEIAAADLVQWFAANAETIISALESLSAVTLVQPSNELSGNSGELKSVVVQPATRECARSICNWPDGACQYREGGLP